MERTEIYRAQAWDLQPSSDTTDKVLDQVPPEANPETRSLFEK